MTCTASKAHSTCPCEKAIDGILKPNSEWSTGGGEPIGAWIQINFGKPYRVTRIKIQHRQDTSDEVMFKDITLKFSSGETIEHTLLPERVTWNIVEVPSDYQFAENVRITAKSRYTKTDNKHIGFAEVQVYACLIKGMCLKLYLSDLIKRQLFIGI